ncbi:MAG: D-3-phosphoglycerate dehydrogenase [Devosia sp.]|uniref:D-2-hydroxyacid dehydrogenase n=1 Tax=Devosia sp. TaxID=1871048 RepID=UPI00260FFE89|nr:D-2-hydroxyacid dehydrogenase [Devosia sp.]MDB5542019.1 D-3-phosphoglycerate dehydrogenase [Devosia sp.]
MSSPSPKPVIVIASPLEEEHVARLRAVGGDRVEVRHEQDLLPKPRYVADHTGPKRTMSAEELARWSALLAEADILFDFDLVDAANLPRNAPKLKWVQATSSGIGELLRRTGLDKSDIAFTTASGVHGRPLAEFAMLGLLHFFRDIPGLDRMKAAKHWERYTVRGLDGARVLVVGLGALGSAVARDAAHFGMEVWGTRRTMGGETPPGVARVIEQGQIREALAEVDALVLACPLTEDTRLLIDLPEIAAMKPGIVIVNISRGQVINETSLIDALKSGQVRGAALDVFEVEPLPKESPMWDLPNVIISPHSASTVGAENRRIVDIFLDNLERFLAGRPLHNLYERDRGY